MGGRKAGRDLKHFAQAGIRARESPTFCETQFYCNRENQKTAATLLICARREACASSNAGCGFPAVPAWGEPPRLRLGQTEFPRRVRTCEINSNQKGEVAN